MTVRLGETQRRRTRARTCGTDLDVSFLAVGLPLALLVLVFLLLAGRALRLLAHSVALAVLVSLLVPLLLLLVSGGRRRGGQVGR